MPVARLSPCSLTGTVLARSNVSQAPRPLPRSYPSLAARRRALPVRHGQDSPPSAHYSMVFVISSVHRLKQMDRRNWTPRPLRGGYYKGGERENDGERDDTSLLTQLSLRYLLSMRHEWALFCATHGSVGEFLQNPCAPQSSLLFFSFPSLVVYGCRSYVTRRELANDSRISPATMQTQMNATCWVVNAIDS